MTAVHDFRPNDAITRVPAKEKYLVPTPIRVQAVRPIMAGRDNIGIAQDRGRWPRDAGMTAAGAPLIKHRHAFSRQAEAMPEPHRYPGSGAAVRLIGVFSSMCRGASPGSPVVSRAPAPTAVSKGS